MANIKFNQRNQRTIELGDKPTIRPLGLPPVQGCQLVHIDNEDFNIPYGYGPEAFENFLADLEDPPALSGSYTWHCQKQLPRGLCGHENQAPRILLDGDDCGNPVALSCASCGHEGISIKKCLYPDCWWNLFQVQGHACKDFCIFHTHNDPENIMDLITHSVTIYGQTYGGQAFLDQCQELDDYDQELEWFTGNETDINLIKTI